ncbi:alpha/beta hydrolase family protein [Nocardia farcinica]|uniref:alpha/beta hydrolase n=1 Tax=Nocardia farcinica TaxID=37329 RepID=UPI00311FABAA
MEKGVRGWLIAAAVLISVSGGASPAPAEPGAGVIDVMPLAPRVDQVQVYSPSMDAVVSSTVIRADGPAPTLYLLAGAGGGTDGISWWTHTDVRQFFADKNVNVVMPIGGGFSLYTDWQADDPVLGRNRWQTFLTRELPAAMTPWLGATGRDAIAGVSMSAASAIDLAIQAGDRYRAVAAYSGCPWRADPPGMTLVAAQVLRGGGNPVNMWGPPGDPGWQSHDAFRNAGALAGKTVYLSAASGIPGPIDRGGLPAPTLEAIASTCTAAFADRLAELGIAAVHVDRPLGGHTWGQFETDLHESWPHLAAALGA